MAKAPCTHPTNADYGRFVGRVGGLAVALGIGLAIANNPAIATADDDQSKTADTPTASSESSQPKSSVNDPNPIKTVVKQLHSRVTEIRQKTETVRDDVSSGLRSLTDRKDRSSSDRVMRTAVRQTNPKPAAPAPNPAIVAVAGFVRRELEHAVAPPKTSEPAAPTAAAAGTVAAPAASPLGTQDQLDAEQSATQTVNTLPVQLMKVVLKTGWYVTALSEFNEVGGPDQENLAQLSRSVDEYAMGAAFQQQLLDPMTPTAVMQVAPPHTWYGQAVGGSRILYDNPDTVYRFMAVNKTSTYVIRGKFEDYNPDDPATRPADTTFSLLTGLSGDTADVLTKDELNVQPNGEFTIYVSAAPPPPGRYDNYMQLTSDSTLIAARDTLADWNTEQPMTLSIERISGPPDSLFSQLGGFAIPLIGPAVTDNPTLTRLVSIVPPLADPPPLLRGAVTSVIMVIGLQMEREYIRVATIDAVTGERRLPNVVPQPASNASFLSTQRQSAGYFQLDDGQALVVTIDPGDAGYFVVPVTNDWTITDNYWDEQTSLNIHQAHQNADGTYTVVISPSDPKVYNWVSTGGLNQGTFSIRFQDLGGENAVAPKIVGYKVVPVSTVRDEFPTTEWVDDHDAQIAERKSGFDKRFAT